MGRPVRPLQQLPREQHPDTYLEELRNAAHRAAHTELLVVVDTAGEILGSVAFVTPGSAYTELAREGEGEFRMLGVDRSGSAWSGPRP